MSVAVIIVAAGRGRRMGGDLPKQYLPLGASCALRQSVEKFLGVAQVQWILPVIHGDDRALCDTALHGLNDPRVLAAVPGGETRALSVRQGLEHLADHGPQTVLIHDAARPFLPLRVVADMIDALETHEGVCAALPVVDALWTAENATALRSVPRDSLWRAQTPQGFDFDRILAAHRGHDGSGADDVAVAREAGMQVRFVLGSENNFKITTQADLERARIEVAREEAGPEAMAQVLARSHS